ncbi:carbohydrate ABC transporter permease [Hungatella hominis]|uniref:Sugar ABC transporter permease n=1 Tax=Hungatella hominis TaxID=2763050 RepID=A0ABR7HD15_9FIRM|nr:sugar ABC transporter permease [Hungatella hominis]MBC5711065.1 sugar ABC transporter permease [Hungatella hominis]
MEERKASRKKFWYNDNTVGYIFSLPFIIGFLAFTLIPIAVSMYYSVTDYKLGQTPAFIGIKNYLELLKDERFINSVKVTLIYVVTSVPTKLIFALFVAYLLTQGRRGVTFYRSLYYVPSLIGGSIAVALVWKTIFSRKGLANTILASLGLQKLSWLGDPKLSMGILVLMSAWQFGSSMIIFAAGLKEIPGSYYEAAEIDGANKWQRFLRITLPCLSPIILYNLVMQTITAFMAFTQAFVITQGGPNDATNFYALYVYNHAFKWSNMGYASAMSWLMLVLISVITLILFKSSKFWVFSEADQ